jgi:hypothetical protein
MIPVHVTMTLKANIANAIKSIRIVEKLYFSGWTETFCATTHRVGQG